MALAAAMIEGGQRGVADGLVLTGFGVAAVALAALRSGVRHLEHRPADRQRGGGGLFGSLAAGHLVSGLRLALVISAGLALLVAALTPGVAADA